MSKTLFSMLATAIMALSACPAFSQDLNATLDEFNARLNGGIQYSTQNIDGNNLRIQQMYKAYLLQGGTLDFPSFCYRYGLNRWFNPEGNRKGVKAPTEMNDQDKERYKRYKEWSEKNSKEIVEYQDFILDEWVKKQAEILNGPSKYVNDASGTSWRLPNTLYPGQYIQDRNTGTVYYMDGQGQYWMNNGQGWQAMRYQQ